MPSQTRTRERPRKRQKVAADATPDTDTALTTRPKNQQHLSAEAAELARHTSEARKQYGRGARVAVKSIKDKKQRGNLQRLEEKYKNAALRAKESEILLEHEAGFLEAESALERTYKVRQRDIKENVGVQTARKGFELRLERGPYRCDYSRNGRDLLLAGRKGHVACVLDWRSGEKSTELQLGETVRDVKWLNNDQRFAVAQKEHVFIYSNDGVELHQLRDHKEARYLEYLPYHFLLASVGNAGWLKYTDTSTGQNIFEASTHLGTPTAFGHNPWNAITHVGHQNGQVTLWSPNSTEPLIKIKAHRGPLRSMAVDREGRYMVSAGDDLTMKVWDIRMYKDLQTYHLPRPGASVAISDRNLVSVGWNTHTDIWRGLFDKNLAEQTRAKMPYMEWGGEGQIVENVRWCPLDDVLGIGHDKGFNSIIVPGAGEANFDALELNPYENRKQRQEAEVKALLDKLQPGTISLNPNFIGRLDLASHEQRMREKDLDAPKEKPGEKIKALEKRGGTGRTGKLRSYLRKKGKRNIVDADVVRAREVREAKKKRVLERVEKQRVEYGPALARFTGKGP
ncbi:U3 small nucleolar RNA-associated protein 7 [Aulographum hederae CBS 113979]|uniref:U three protein 7 n=1 Tax=Aulographum hederae CBS 113979 TaxID=1176131 RepID=A0A6G1HET6_9PEZI|nr:U3 small nucleolar RNA-associated protein 7 [Aulographum hederae CBS 113979]